MENEKRKKSDEIIKNHILWSMGAGVIPLPLLDIAAVTAVQLDMLKQLCKLYEIDYTERSGKSLVAAMAGSSLARMGASMIKSIPGIGTFIGEVSMFILSGAATYALGQVFVHHFEKGLGLDDIDPKKGKEMYKKEFEEGKSYAEKAKKENENPPEND